MSHGHGTAIRRMNTFHQTSWKRWSTIRPRGVETPPPHSCRQRCWRAWSPPQSRLHQVLSVRCIKLEQCKGVRSVMAHDHPEDWSWFHSQSGRDAGAESHNRFCPLLDTVSSDDEPLVGRSAVPTDRDATMTTALSSILPASSRALARVHSRIDDDGSDEDRSWGGQRKCVPVSSCDTESVQRVEGRPRCSSCPHGWLWTQDDTESVVSRSSTRSAAADDSLGRIHAVHRRLRLVWYPEQNLSSEVHAAATMIRSLADRVGPVPRGSIVPGAIRRQRWSAMYVPLMWAAAGQAACSSGLFL